MRSISEILAAFELSPKLHLSSPLCLLRVSLPKNFIYGFSAKSRKYLPRQVVVVAEEKVVVNIRQFDWNPSLHFQGETQMKQIEKDFEVNHPCLRLDSR